MFYNLQRFHALFFLTTILFVGTVNADSVDKYVRSQMAERHIPGAAIAVIKKGKVVKMKGYGMASLEFRVHVTTKTVFEIGSVSKQITSAAILLLVQDGRVKLDEDISTYLPDSPEAWRGITVRHLLTHTSGIQSYTRLGGFELFKSYTVKDFIEEVSKHKLEFKPGAGYRYNNSGYNLLGFIVESASGKSYWEFLDERIYKPLGMNSTANRDPQFVIPNRANGYEWRNEKFVGRDYILTDLFSAGAIVSTIEDLTKWDRALRDESLLSAASKKEMWTPYVLSTGEQRTYGLGWIITELRGQKLIRHSGQTAGFATNISRFVDSDLSVIVLTNSGSSGQGTYLSHGIAKFYIPSISLKALKVKTNPNSKIDDLFSTTLMDVLKGTLDSEELTPALKTTLSSTRSRANMNRIARSGKITEIDFIDEEVSGGRKIYTYRVKTKKKITLWSFGIDAAGKVAQLELEEEE